MNLIQFHVVIFITFPNKQSATLLQMLLSTTDPNLLIHVLSALKVVFTQAVTYPMITLDQHGEIRDQLDQLLVHPVQLISNAAGELEDVISNYTQAMDDT